MKNTVAGIVIPGVVAIAGIALLAWWTGARPTEPLDLRLPGMDKAPPLVRAESLERPVPGTPIRSEGQPSQIAGSWPWFRGEKLDGICHEDVRLARSWPKKGPRQIWMVEMGEGYAAPAISGGCIYVLDHVPDEGIDLLRGLSQEQRDTLADALESLTTETFDRIDPVLDAVSKGLNDDLKQVLRQLVSEDRDRLIAALRDDALDRVDRSADVMRCLSLEKGEEIWRNSYRVIVPFYHGRSRTVPAVIGDCVISLGPKCHVACWDAKTGECRWKTDGGNWLIDLVLDYDATVPQWYAGQCPLVDPQTDRLILATGGKALLIAVDYRTGEVVWESPNPDGWGMTHASITPMDFGGRRMYVYCGSGGVAGIAADDGSILWQYDDWRNSVAMSPSPVCLPETPEDGGRIFLTSGYDVGNNVGSLMLQLKTTGGRFAAEELFTLSLREFGTEQQTPILFEDHLYGVRKKGGQLVCLDLQGNELWNSGKDKFGSAPYLIADGLIYALNDRGRLTMAEATPTGYHRLGQAQVIKHGHDSWGPMALVAGRLIVRDMTRMVCLDVMNAE